MIQLTDPESNGSPSFRESRRETEVVEAKRLRGIDETRFFISEYGGVWTVTDELRLQTLDALHSRTLEYHNNIYQRLMLQSNLDAIKSSESGFVCDAMIFSDSNPTSKPYQASIQQILLAIEKFRSSQDSSVLWINLQDFSVFPAIAEFLKMNPVCISNFSDVRANSMFIPTPNGTLLSTLYFHLNAISSTATMIKQFIYMTNNIVLTYETEVMGNIENPVDVGFSMTACNAVLNKWETIRSLVISLGPMQLLYELIMESINMQGTVIEFISRSLFYFKTNIDAKLRYPEKLEFLKKIHTIDSVLNMLGSYYARNKDSVGCLVDLMKENGGRICNAESLRDKINESLPIQPFAPILSDLMQSYDFTCECVEDEKVENRRLHDALEVLTTIRANKASMILSLIATVFLPITFLTGVFGMNFQEHGGYTINLVNNKHGPYVFYSMCILVFIFCMVFFINQGWIEPFFTVEWALYYICGESTAKRFRRHATRGVMFALHHALRNPTEETHTYDLQVAQEEDLRRIDEAKKKQEIRTRQLEARKSRAAKLSMAREMSKKGTVINTMHSKNT